MTFKEKVKRYFYMWIMLWSDALNGIFEFVYFVLISFFPFFWKVETFQIKNNIFNFLLEVANKFLMNSIDIRFKILDPKTYKKVNKEIKKFEQRVK